MIRRLLPLAGVFYAFLAPAQQAAATTGELSFTAYKWTDTPTAQTECATGSFTTLVLEWDSQPVDGCPDDNFLLDIQGKLYSPGTSTQYAILSDDGIRVTIDGQLVVSNWWDRGCDGFVHDLQLSEGWHDIRIEYYENGGGTCLWLYQVTALGWSQIPAAYLNSDETAVPLPTTKPTAVEVLPSTTTTTIEEPTTTTIEPTTTSSTLYQPTESTTSPTTTATIDTSVQTSPAIPSTIPEIPATVASTIEPTTTAISTSTTTTSIMSDKITESMSNEEALALATDASAVAELTVDQAAELFASIDESSVTPEQAAAIVEAVQDAPPSIREQFEEKVNIFAGVYDGYIPLGSLVPVGTRRILIITTGLLVALPSTRKN
jgi:hypothetical protein